MAQLVELRRGDTGQTWGFKMQGGTDVNMPLFVAHVSPYTSNFHRFFTVIFNDLFIQQHWSVRTNGVPYPYCALGPHRH